MTLSSASQELSLADLFASQLEDLKQRSDESDRSIAEHIKKLYSLIDEMKAIDLETDKSVV